MRKFGLFGFGALLLSGTCFAQGFGNDCTPAGVWYGGNTTASSKYLRVITPGPAGRFTQTLAQGFTPRIPHLTPFAGELVKTSTGWENFTIALSNNDTTPPPGAPNPDLRAVHAKITFESCDRFTETIDFYALYEWGAIPFEDEPKEILLAPGQKEVSVYTRVPTKCKYCPEQ